MQDKEYIAIEVRRYNGNITTNIYGGLDEALALLVVGVQDAFKLAEKQWGHEMMRRAFLFHVNLLLKSLDIVSSSFLDTLPESEGTGEEEKTNEEVL